MNLCGGRLHLIGEPTIANQCHVVTLRDLRAINSFAQTSQSGLTLCANSNALPATSKLTEIQTCPLEMCWFSNAGESLRPITIVPLTGMSSAQPQAVADEETSQRLPQKTLVLNINQHKQPPIKGTARRKAAQRLRD